MRYIFLVKHLVKKQIYYLNILITSVKILKRYALYIDIIIGIIIIIVKYLHAKVAK